MDSWMNPFPDRGRGRETLSKNVRSEDKAQAMLRAFFPVPEAPKDGHVLGRLAKRDTDVMGCDGLCHACRCDVSTLVAVANMGRRGKRPVRPANREAPLN